MGACLSTPRRQHYASGSLEFHGVGGYVSCSFSETASLLRRQHCLTQTWKAQEEACACFAHAAIAYALLEAGVAAAANVNSLNSFSQGRPCAMSMRRSSGIMI